MRLHRPALPALLGLLVALALLPVVPAHAAADTSLAAACDGTRIRSAATAGTVVDKLPLGTLVTVAGTTTGDAWSVTCPSTSSGNTWYQITSVNGVPVSTAYPGYAIVYGATVLFQVPPPPPPPGQFLEGIDVSQWQNTINWPLVPGAGKSFVIMRATLGETYVDPTYATNHAGARQVGLAVTAYHYAKPSLSANDAIIQADNFVENAALLPGDLLPALDIEETGGLAPADLQAWVQSWLTEVNLRLGVHAMIYSNPSFWTNAMGNTTMFADEGYTTLWVAHWTSNASPTVPANNWEGHGWTFWQYSDCGAVAGIGGCVDLDRYNGLDLTPVKVNYSPVGPIGLPVLTSVAPTTVGAGSGDTTLTVAGANFVSGASTVYWNGAPLTTTFVSTTQLTAVLPAAMTTVPTTGTVTVLNQTPGGGFSVPAMFTVTLQPADLTIASSASVVSWGKGVTLTVHLGPTGANRQVTILRMQANETAFAPYTTLQTDANGNASLPNYTPPVNTLFEASFAGAPDLGPATSSPIRVVVRQFVVLRPTNFGSVKSVRAGTAVTFTATIRPIGPTLAPGKATFAFFHYVGGRWQRAATRDVAADRYGRASTSWTFSSGGQWYVRAVADPTPTNANSYWSPLERYSVY